MIDVVLHLELNIKTDVIKREFFKRTIKLPMNPFPGLRTIHGIIKIVSVNEQNEIHSDVEPVFITLSPNQVSSTEIVQKFVCDGWWLEV